MINIALCDNDSYAFEPLNTFVKQYFEETNREYNISCFLSPLELYEYMSSNTINIVIMDLKFETDEEDGIKWTKKIHEEYPDTITLIYTAYEERYKEGYRARAFGFMTKPLTYKEFKYNMDDCIYELSDTKKIFINKKSDSIYIQTKNISYIESHFGESAIHVKDKIYYHNASLTKLENELDEKFFFRVHKSCLVNMRYIKSINQTKHEITLKYGEKISVSRRKWTTFQTSYIKYDISRNL